MAEFDLNLSTRPFPAYRVTNLALSAILVVLVLVSAWQAYGFIQYSSLSGQIRGQEEELRVQSQALGHQLEEVESRLDRPEATAKLNEIGYLNGLITRKNFSWTRIFASLEDMVPETVHLLDLRPEFAPDGSVLLHLNVRGRDIEDVAGLIDTMEASAAFDNVKVSSEVKVEAEVEVGLSVNYHPQKDRP
jgi:Tfp pilus assembly protein PilN